MLKTSLTMGFIFAGVTAQQACTGTECVTPEVPLELSIKKCSIAGGCAVDGKTYATMDANWRWTQEQGGYSNCWDNNEWISDSCSSKSDQSGCATKCMLEGVNYDDYGVTSSGNALTMKFMGKNKNVGSRLYMLENTAGMSAKDSSAEAWQYKAFHLKNKEMTFTVDGSTLSCALNGPIYLAEMDVKGDYDGDGNTAGPLYGTGYCDAQCPGDIHFVQGKANIPMQDGETESAYRHCCNEIDLWEANVVSTAVTTHPCSIAGGGAMEGPFVCEDGAACLDRCDTAGCDFASYRLQYFNGGAMGDDHVDFWGTGSSTTLDSSKPVTVVTQFVTDDGTDDGELVEVRRLYVQDDVVVHNFNATLPTSGGVRGASSTTFDSITDAFCEAQANAFDGGEQHHAAQGGLKAVGDSLDRGMVLVLSLWDDKTAHMLWLDGKFPPDEAATKAGTMRGDCSTTQGPPMEPEQQFADVYVTYSNLKYGEIGSTFGPGHDNDDAPLPAADDDVPVAGGCCSWSACAQCDPTTAYCNGSKKQCEGDCNGTWCDHKPADALLMMMA